MQICCFFDHSAKSTRRIDLKLSGKILHKLSDIISKKVQKKLTNWLRYSHFPVANKHKFMKIRVFLHLISTNQKTLLSSNQIS